MPIYVYEPDNPENSSECCYFENLENIRAEPLTRCPTCDRPIHRGVTSFALASGPSASKPQTKEGGLFSSSSQGKSPAGNAANLAMRHMCGAGCRH